MARVLVPLAEGCEELETVTITDLLVRAGVTVVSAGLREGPVRCSRGTVIIPETTLDQALESEYDMVILPGGLPGADRLDNDPRVRELLVRMANAGKFIAAICAAPKVLASAGLLDGKKATSYPGSIDPGSVPGLTYVDQAVVVDKKLITSRGPGTAMDFALELIEQLTGKENRDKVESALARS
ncbi:MAG TPA: DJ-1/PfpI family protein [Gammaproteobacteria bacterium]|nr:DJ-1/PfpI family protein [Gammaproteobacteria bacterium]